MKEYMSDEARRYYEGGKRVMIDGAPCRVAAWARRTPGKAFIKAAVAGQVEIDGDNRPDELARFRFVPANGARLVDCKPAKRRGYAAPVRYRARCGWKPENLAYDPYAAHTCLGGLTDTPEELGDALAHYQNGNPKPLRDWLAETADERRAYWAAYDAAREAETAASYRLAA